MIIHIRKFEAGKSVEVEVPAPSMDNPSSIRALTSSTAKVTKRDLFRRSRIERLTL